MVLRAHPSILVVVPVFNEARLIGGKLTNLARLSYPSDRHHVVIIDGGSTDGTVDQLNGWMSRHRGFTMIHTTLRDKTAQIAVALSACAETEWVLVTDVDARTDADIIEQLLAVTTLDPSTGVVGTPVEPRNAHPLERLHWRFADWLREHEFHCGSAGIVAGPCYLARRELIAGMPPDTVADDVHVACRAMAAGQRVGFRRSALVVEMRSPNTLLRLFTHKYRKASAYFREIFRFLPHACLMPEPMRRVFLWRAALMMGAPVTAAVGCTAIVTAFESGAVTASEMIVPLLPALLALAMRRGRHAAQLAALAALLTCASVAALVTYPFLRQTASFPKVLDPADLPSEPA
jgi:cellulose synthase/poly-beta-1,6-N-acetylglucosamine synthase-like glycosyltransferase